MVPTLYRTLGCGMAGLVFLALVVEGLAVTGMFRGDGGETAEVIGLVKVAGCNRGVTLTGLLTSPNVLKPPTGVTGPAGVRVAGCDEGVLTLVGLPKSCSTLKPHTGVTRPVEVKVAGSSFRSSAKNEKGLSEALLAGVSPYTKTFWSTSSTLVVKTGTSRS